ncbi:ABC transporter ATP-binding protein [Gloeocapsopsis crepidinum LEGE 06123]|uniref:ABC transporter ATP-binding protein n=1 Tax=Gloeocapsopsis crepidinum LEGE 06123 TaxID=588587 RepID=A0ABR9UR62_9CHRO|nr:ABC transporter ATP-binding protein [Gloeocapsopsis crepidinum]MBE9190773.1 ABC transporter ATP-binding protein [Gloeocapsopsis crepidinum LEGE 06123]
MSRRPKNIKEALPGLSRIFSRFAPQIRKQKLLIGASFLALLAETAFRLLEPWPLKLIFDYIIVSGFQTEALPIPALRGLNPVTLLTIFTGAIVAIALARAAAAYCSTVGMAIAATQVMTEIRGNLYTHLQRLSLSFHSKIKSGDLITRVTYDVERLREATVTAALPLFTNILTLIGMLGVMFWLNWELATLAIAAFPLFVFSTFRTTKSIQGVARTQRKREGAMAATAAEAIGAIKVVQALSLQKILEGAFASQNKKSLKDGARVQRLSAALERSVEALVALATALVLWRGVQLVLTQAISPGDLLVFINYLKTAFKPMRYLAKYTGQIAKATASGERIIDLLDAVPDIRDTRGAIAAPPFRGKVQFENVTFAYEPEQPVLRNVSFTIKPGQQVALVGPSGGGKSSLVSLLLRLYDPLEGRILIDGRDLREYKLDSLRQQISIVLQDSVLFAVSVRDNISYGSLTATQQEIEAAAKLANAHDFIMAMPQGYNTVLSERGSTLSGGQRQRIAIARAAVRQAPIVILDEPTTGLDNQNERAVSEALDRLTAGRTTFIISHNLRTTEQADVILYIEQGKVLETGTHQELICHGGRYATLYRMQAAIGNEVLGEDYALKAE